jgi:hypothetical protein
MIEQIKPGQYRTRNGIVAVVTHTNDKMEAPFIWVGSVAGEIEVWDRNGRYYINGKESPLDLVARIPDAAPVDDRIERALQVLRDAQAYDWVEADVLSEVRKILESTP